MAIDGSTRSAHSESSPRLAVSLPELVRELEELIEALDRRLPRVERAGEAAIARDAAALRARAVARLKELAEASSPQVPEESGDPT